MKKLLLSVVALMAAGAAQASIIPTLAGNPVDTGGGVFRYTYTATLASDQALQTNNYFSLYDIAGFTGFGSLPTGFTGSSQLVGRTPGNVIPNDDPAITNVTFTYSGPTLNYNPPTSERELGNFEIFSTVGTFSFDDFTSQAVRNSGEARGSLVATIGNDAVAVPGDGNGGGSTVPEPATWAFMMTGFAFLGASMRRRNKILARAA